MTQPVSKGRLRAGWAVSGLVVLFMLMDGITKIIRLPQVVEATVQIGFPANQIVTVGILGTLSTLLYAFPRTAVLGAVFLTGYLGGATATQLHINANLFNSIFPAMFGVLVWLGLFLRDGRVLNFLLGKQEL